MGHIGSKLERSVWETAVDKKKKKSARGFGTNQSFLFSPSFSFSERSFEKYQTGEQRSHKSSPILARDETLKIEHKENK